MSTQLWTVLAVIITTFAVVVGWLWHLDQKFDQKIDAIDAKREADWIRLDAKREADWRELHGTLDKVNELYANMSGRLDALFNQPR